MALPFVLSLYRLAAMKALNNAIIFIKSNFENEGERNYIMQTICEALMTVPTDPSTAEAVVSEI